MSVTKTMTTGVAGLRAHEAAIGIVGDNIANATTIGFKHSRALFEDVLGNAVALRTREPGAGVRMARAQQIFSQGSLQDTGVATDLAISGTGFFVFRGVVDGMAGQFFSRAGNLSVRHDGVIVSPQGLELQGYQAQSNGGFSSSLSNIKVEAFTLPPKPTDQMGVIANLDSNAVPPALPFDVNDPVGTSSFSTSITVYDTQGNGHQLDTYFVKTGVNTWDVHVLAASADLSAPPPASPGDTFTEVGTGALTFDGTGKLLSAPPNFSVGLTFVNCVPQNIAIDVGDPTATGGTGQAGLTQYGSPSSVSNQSQNGFAPADLANVDIRPDGTVNGVYSNGETLAIAQIAIAKFHANEGLARAGHSLWLQTIDSGVPAIGVPSTGGRGAVISGALEQSNVDLTGQFVDMITYQRTFSANAKTISTADEMLMETVNLKR